MDNTERVLIKYDYSGQEVKMNHKTIVQFNNKLCLMIKYLGYKGDTNDFLKAIEGKPIIMTFVGMSRDKMHIFTIDRKRVMRNQKLNIILE